MNAKKTLGALIAENRKQKGLTQLELAAQLGVTDKAVSKWERDLACPDINTLPALADALGLTLDELIQGRSEKQPGKTPGALVDTILKAVALASTPGGHFLPGRLPLCTDVRLFVTFTKNSGVVLESST